MVFGFIPVIGVIMNGLAENKTPRLVLILNVVRLTGIRKDRNNIIDNTQAWYLLLS